MRSAVRRTITPAGTVDVPRARVLEIQTAAELAWVTYLRHEVGIGGIVRIAKLEAVVMDAGAINVTDITLNGGVVNVDLEADEVGTPSDGSTLLNAITWRPI